MSGCFPKEDIEQMKGLVEEKVNNYRLGVDRHEVKELTEKSPSLKELENGPHRVKALSKMFENKLDVPGKKDSTGKLRSFIRRISIELEVEKPTNLQRTVLELIHTEETYIQNLEHGIKNFMKIIKEGGAEVPTSLQHQSYRLFGNIEDILQFNKNFFQRLIACGKNVRNIAEMFTNLIQDEHFYCYVVYNVNYKNVEIMTSTYLDFFKKTFNGRLGIESFLIQPVQRLPRYQLILCAMIKELSKDLTNTDKTSLAACCIAEKNVQRLLTRCNEGMMIHDIVETHEVSLQLGILAMQTDHGVTNGEPGLLLIPRACSNFPMRRAFNIYSLGRFLKTFTLQAKEVGTDLTFPTKLFIFDRFLLYTKMISNISLTYRNHFSFTTGFSFMLQESRYAFRVSDGNRSNDVLFFSFENVDAVSDAKKLIGQFYDPRRSNDSAFSSMPVTEESEITSDDDSEWEMEDTDETLDETVHVANSCFYLQSPKLESN